MRALWLLLLVAALLVVTAFASPWITLGLDGIGFRFRFSAVYDRVFEVLLVAAMLAAWRPLDLGDATQIGLRRGGGARAFGQGLVVGGCAITVGLGACWLGGALVPALRFDPGKTAWEAFIGLLGAVVVGIGEEVLFRGVLLRRLTADAGRAVGVLGSTALYAVVHALRPGAQQASVWAGVHRTLALFAPLGDRDTLISVAGLFGLGLLLVFARLRSGGLWLPIGIHAAFVAAFRVGRLVFDIRRDPVWLVGAGWPPLVGGVGGLVALAVAFALLTVVFRRDAQGDGRKSSAVQSAGRIP